MYIYMEDVVTTPVWLIDKYYCALSEFICDCLYIEMAQAMVLSAFQQGT